VFRSLFFRLVFVLLLLSVCFRAYSQSNVEDRTETVKIIINNWTSQLVMARILSGMLEEVGYDTEYIESDTHQQWGALAYGAAHIQVEVWEGTMSDMFNRMLAEGNIVDAGTHEAKTREDWWYPDYVEDVCPELPLWTALKRCAALFRNADSEGLGVYYAGPWEKPDETRIRALGLGFKVELLTQGDDLWVKLKAAAEKRQPIVLFNWTPNWVESRYSGKFVEFPEYAPECETDPEWGINPGYIHDCGNPKNGWLKKAVWAGLEAKWPCAYKMVTNLSFSNSQIAQVAAYVDIDGLSYDQAAEKWLAENEPLWRKWVPEQCR
jgi:glycine betaine/proline transport system substrate-binding protein